MIQQDHLQIFDLTLNVWAPLFVGNGSSYTKKEYMYNTRNGKVSFLDEQKFFGFLVEHDLVDKYGQFMLSEQSNLWAFLSKDCGISDAELKTLTRYQIEVGDALDAEHSLKEIHAFQRDAQGHAYIPGSSINPSARHLDKAANHLLGSVEIRDNSLTKRSYGTNIRVRLLVHLTGHLTDSQHLVRASIQSNHRRFVYHHLIITRDNGIGGTQIYGNFLCERKQSH